MSNGAPVFGEINMEGLVFVVHNYCKVHKKAAETNAHVPETLLACAEFSVSVISG